MPGLLIVHLDDEVRSIQRSLDEELIARAVAQKVGDSEEDLIVRDGLPLTDFATTTTGASSSSTGYTNESWFIDMSTYQRDGSTASAVASYNEAINVNLDKQKVVGIFGVKKGYVDNVAAVKFGFPGGVQVKDIWQIDHLDPGEDGYTETPIIFDSSNKMQVQYYLKTLGGVDLKLYTRVCEVVGDTIMGGAKPVV